MTQPTLDELNRDHGVDGLRFEQTRGPLIEAVIDGPAGSARVALQGAQVLAYAPTGARPVIWTSKRAMFANGKGVRGGVPVCWPWFGPHPEGLGAHGFVRTRPWQVVGTERAGDNVVLTLAIEDDAQTREIWPHPFRLSLRISVGESLDLELITENRDDVPLTITQALHTYLAVGDLVEASVQGLEGAPYIDKLDEARRHRTEGAVTFEGPMDRIYVDLSGGDLVVDDPTWDRRVRVARRHSHSAVLWTPWEQGAEDFADMSPAEYRDMVCVESTNAAEDAITVEPGERAGLGTTLSVEPRAESHH